MELEMMYLWGFVIVLAILQVIYIIEIRVLRRRLTEAHSKFKQREKDIGRLTSLYGELQTELDRVHGS